MDLSEKETRERKIDPILNDAGWRDEYIKREVNCVKSDFQAKKYEIHSKNSKKEEGRFIDYVLLDSDKSVLAIIEAKRFSLYT